MIFKTKPFKSESDGNLSSYFLEVIAFKDNKFILPQKNMSDKDIVIIPKSDTFDNLHVAIHVISGEFTLEYTLTDPTDELSIWEEWDIGKVSTGEVRKGSIELSIGAIRVKGLEPGSLILSVREIDRR